MQNPCQFRIPYVHPLQPMISNPSQRRLAMSNTTLIEGSAAEILSTEATTVAKSEGSATKSAGVTCPDTLVRPASTTAGPAPHMQSLSKVDLRHSLGKAPSGRTCCILSSLGLGSLHALARNALELLGTDGASATKSVQGSTTRSTKWLGEVVSETSIALQSEPSELNALSAGASLSSTPLSQAQSSSAPSSQVPSSTHAPSATVTSAVQPNMSVNPTLPVKLFRQDGECVVGGGGRRRVLVERHI
ncbi:hypothetical protein AX14_005672 [Amanita brunnescens Koide BX004]|nr:hypothetical protein AX14_005672 [Amanita brunnescens Koide BX004]